MAIGELVLVSSPTSGRAHGGWLAVVLMPADSVNGQSSVTMQLWLEPDLITTDLTRSSDLYACQRFVIRLAARSVP